MPFNLEGLIFLAVVGLLILLRFDARRFGAAEWDDEDAPGGWQIWLRRLSWYVFGLLLILVVYFVYPTPFTNLHLQIGTSRNTALFLGLALGGLGSLYAFAYAWWRFAELRLPPAHRYPAALLNSLGTAIIDEATFRGIVLGLLVAFHWPAQLAVFFQAILYVLATRLAGRHRPVGMLLLSLLIGVAGGFVTLATAGIGAALLAHTLTRFAVFIATGHGGWIRAAAAEAEEEEAFEEISPHTPRGWEVVIDPDSSAPRDYRW
jgi:hypothetical protein